MREARRRTISLATVFSVSSSMSMSRSMPSSARSRRIGSWASSNPGRDLEGETNEETAAERSDVVFPALRGFEDFLDFPSVLESGLGLEESLRGVLDSLSDEEEDEELFVFESWSTSESSSS